jgi:hypothetical protein
VAEIGPHVHTNRTLLAPTLTDPTKAKVKVQAKAHAPKVRRKEKAKPTPATKATALPTKTPALTVEAPATTHAIAINVWQKRRDKQQQFINKRIKISSLMRL